MSPARKVTKRDFELLSNLVFDSYTTREVELANHHFLLRSLTTKEREDISRCYQYLSSKFNIMLVLDVLIRSIVYIDGSEFNKEKHASIFKRFNSRLVFKLYEEYQLMDKEIIDSSKFIDYYLETRESRNMWSVFKTCSRIQDAFSIKHLNQYQYYWIVTNVYKDSLEKEKKSWAKVEYMTNSICGFINPKAFRKSRSGSSVVEQLEQQEDKVKQRIVEELEYGERQQVVESNDVFSSMAKQDEENDEEYEARINILMEKTLSGELVDEHDRIVRASEIECLKSFLREKRTQVLVEREVYAQKGIEFDDSSVLDNEAYKIQLEEDKQKGFFHDEFSYLDVVMMKDFASVPRREKEIAFEDVMNEYIDIDKEVEHFLKSLSGDSNTSKQTLSSQQQDTMDNRHSDDSEGETDFVDDVDMNVARNAAEQAAKMDINVKNVDLFKQRKEKMQKAVRVLNRRNIKPKQDPDLDVMKFE